VPNYGIFDRLGFPSSLENETIVYSSGTLNSMNSMPALLEPWQFEDMANNAANGYLYNPVSNSANSIIVSLESIIANTTGIVELVSIETAANNLIKSNNVIYYREHTDRLSGVTGANTENVSQPYLESVIGIGKILSYLVYQSDDVSNNAVMIGSLGSILTYNTFSNMANTLNVDATTVNTSITGGVSSLTVGQITQIVSDINNVNTFILNTMSQDLNFYANSRNLLSEYSSLKGFSKMGQTEDYLYKNYIGTPKLLERL